MAAAAAAAAAAAESPPPPLASELSASTNCAGGAWLVEGMAVVFGVIVVAVGVSVGTGVMCVTGASPLKLMCPDGEAEVCMFMDWERDWDWEVGGRNRPWVCPERGPVRGLRPEAVADKRGKSMLLTCG